MDELQRMADHPGPEPAPVYSATIPSVLDGLTVGQALDVMGFQYRITAHEVQPARYRGKQLTRRALRYRRRHWASVVHRLTAVPA